MVSPEALREHWTAPAPTHNHNTLISNPITEVGAARPTRNPPLERTHQGKLTTSWISPHPTKDLLKGSKLHQICDDGHLVTIHSPDGHCMAVLTRERATILWHWYWQTNPDAGSQETFAIEVATMCAHYSSNKLYIKNQKSTPQEMASQIAKAIGATTERFSSPLNANPTFRDHYSNRKADAVFGFKFDAYSARFSSPGFMCPGYQAEETAKAIRWAAASAAASREEPNLTIAIVPKCDTASHTAMMNTPGVHVLATLRKGFQFNPHNTWSGEAAQPTGTKYPVNIIAIYNSAGLHTHGSGLSEDGELASYLTREHKLQGAYKPPPTLPLGTKGPIVGQKPSCHLLRRWPPKLRLIPEETPTVWREQPLKAKRTNWKRPGRLRWDKHAVAYTDGSKLDPGRAGAGVYYPKSSDSTLDTSPPLPLEGALMRHAPKKPAWRACTFVGVQNSLRAELVALLQAVLLRSDHARLAVFTDCLTALHLIKKYWAVPHTMALHHELPLIKAIADAVASSTWGVDFVKVKAHAGLHGNEVADRIANLAAGSKTDNVPEGVLHLTDTESTHPAGIGLVCPWSAVSPNVKAHADPDRTEGSPFHIYNARTTVSHLSQYAFERSLLTANAHIHTVLPKSLAQALGEDPLNPLNPHRPMRTIGKGYQSCCANSSFKTMLRVRAGDYFAGNPAYYAGATDTNRCTICDDTSMEGGWAHTLSSCFNPVIKGMRINRHNELVRMMRDAILHSKKGNANQKRKRESVRRPGGIQTRPTPSSSDGRGMGRRARRLIT